MSNKRAPNGFTLVELLIVVAIVGTVAAIALPGLVRARMSGNEAAAIGSLRAIATAEKAYSQQCSTPDAYAVSLTTLGTGAPPFLTSELTTADPSYKSGYTFSLAPGAGATAVTATNCPGAQTAFYATATPTSVGVTGSRAFATNVLDAIWQDTSGTPPAEPFGVSGTVSPIQ